MKKPPGWEVKRLSPVDQNLNALWTTAECGPETPQESRRGAWKHCWGEKEPENLVYPVITATLFRISWRNGCHQPNIFQKVSLYTVHMRWQMRYSILISESIDALIVPFLNLWLRLRLKDIQGFYFIVDSFIVVFLNLMCLPHGSSQADVHTGTTKAILDQN